MSKGAKTSKLGTTARISHDSSQYDNSRLYSELSEDNGDPPVPNNVFPSEYENTIILGTSEKMRELPDNSVPLMITSPPYNVTKEYDENLTLNKYLQLLRNVFTETHRVLVYGSRACGG